MSKEVTLFITSCGRPKLLRRTIESFVKYNTYPINEVILCEDSGVKGIVDFAKDVFPYPIIFCYNEVRSGQMKTIERYTPLIKTPYVFHLEDDYEFFDSQFIELSLKIEATIKGLNWNSDFTFNVINDTRLLMSDILPYYIENEMYEKCSDIRNLYIYLEARNSKFKKNCNKDI